jgi:DNA-binding transcriptional LysR family regulator
MTKSKRQINWDDLRLFLAACRAGNLRAAAQAVALDQSTLGRRIEALEYSMHAQLFLRSNRGIVMTDAARSLIEYAESVETTMIEVERSVWGQDAQLEGTIKIASSDGFGPFWITPHLKDFQREYPQIKIDMLCDEDDPDLNKSKAHLIFRLGRPLQENLICLNLGVMRFELFASEAYREQYGLPASKDELLSGRHKFVTLHDSNHTSVTDPWWSERWNDWSALCSQPNAVAFATNSSTAMIKATLAGFGISIMSHYIEAQFSDLVRIEPSGWEKPSLPITMLYHESAKNSKRVRLLIDYLVATIGRWKKERIATV